MNMSSRKVIKLESLVNYIDLRQIYKNNCITLP